MSSEWTALENSTGEIKVTCEGEAWVKAQKKAFDRLAKNVKIAGFRNGKAPLDLVRKQIDNKKVQTDALEAVASDLLIEALAEHELAIVTRPQLDIRSISAEKAEITFKVTVKPEVTLGQYRQLKVKKAEVKIEEAAIDHQIEHLRLDNAELALKEQGQAELGDTMVLDFQGFINEEQFEGGSAENYSLELGSGNFIPGFEQQLVGMSSGERKDVNVTFPTDYQAEHLAGKEALFVVEAKEIKSKILPKVDDEFAVSLALPEVADLAQLRQSIHDRLLSQATKEAEDNYQRELTDQLLADSQVEIPAVMIDDETDDLYQEFVARLKQQGYNEELYYQLSGQNKEFLLDQMRTDAAGKVKLRLVLEAIAKKEEIVAEESEIAQEYRAIAEKYKIEVAEVKKALSPETISDDVKLKKAMEIVTSTAESPEEVDDGL